MSQNIFKKMMKKDITKNTLPVIQELEKEKEKMVPSTDDFIAKTEEEVIRVPKCTYANDIKKQAKYFLCLCSSQDFEPICEACASICHKEHHPTLEVMGTNTCSCGLNNHIKSQAILEDRNASTQPQCFYSKFFSITPNKGYYTKGDITYCAVCVVNCLGANFDDQDIIPVEEENDSPKLTCNCDNSHEVNVIKLNADFIARRHFHKFLRNFNFNILFKIPKSKQIYIDALISQISLYKDKKTVKQNLDFFSNFLNFKILELFSSFAVFWENKFFHVVPFLSEFKNDTLFHLMSLNDLANELNDEIATNFVSAKFYFAELLFNYFVRSFMLKFNNIWNFRTILNMNLYQRTLYIKNLKEFHKFGPTKFKDNLEDLVIHILDLYDSILKINERYQIIDRIMSYVFPTFNRIMKYIIKFNIITEESKKKYFDLVLETLHIHNEKSKGSVKDSVFYIMKSVIYTVVYNNDQTCLDIIRGKHGKKRFVFQIKEDSLKLSKIFLCILNHFDRKEDLNRTIIYDYYVRKFLEMMLDKDDFYINAIKNLEEEEMKLITISDSGADFVAAITRTLNKDYFKTIYQFTSDLNKYNRSYFNYDIQHEAYLKYVNDLVTIFHQYVVNAKIMDMQEISVKYNIFTPLADQKNTKNLQEFKQCVLYSTLFQKIEELLHIYSQGKIFPARSRNTEINEEELLDNLRFVLRLLFALCNRDPKMLTLVMNIKPKVFVTAFYDIPELLIQFLERISEIFYSGVYTYQFENFYFFSECICELLIINQEQLNPILLLPSIMNLCVKSLHKIKINAPDFLNAVEQFSIIFNDLSENETIMQRIKDFFNNKPYLFKKKASEYSRDKKKKKNAEEKDTEIESLLSSYFNFISEIKINDISFYDYLKEGELLKETEIKTIFEAQLKDNFTGKSIELEYSLTRLFFLITEPFHLQVNTIEDQIKNLYMPYVHNSISLTHLSKQLIKDVGVNKLEQLLKTTRTLLDVFNKIYEKINDKLFTNRLLYMKYYENIIVRASYTLFTFFILFNEEITGRDCQIFYQLTFMFLKLTLQFYNSSLHSENIAENPLKFSYEECAIKTELTKPILDDIFADALELANNIKYFQLERIFQIYKKVIENILIREQDKELVGLASKLSSHHTKLIKTEQQINQLLKEKLVEKYQRKKEKTYDENLSLIKAIGMCMSEMDKDFSIDIIQYLMTKLFDPLTDLNIRTTNIKEYEPNDKYIGTYKFQNLYVLIYLNDFFYHDSLNFQKAFETPDIVDNTDNFFQFIAEKIIVASTLNEVKKLYSIDYLSNEQSEPRVIGRNETLSFQMGKYAIKFIQNLCEGHNMEFQTRFFYLLLNTSMYIEGNKNIYDQKDLPQDSVSGSFVMPRTIIASTPENIPESQSNDSVSSNQLEEDKLPNLQVSFFNLICYMMRIINNNLQVNSSYQSRLLKEVSHLKSYDNIQELYLRFSDLIVEMIQGTDPSNFQHFYQKLLPVEFAMFNEDGSFIVNPEFKIFIFLSLAYEIQEILFNQEQAFNDLSFDMKYDLFVTMNNVLSQENIDYSIVKAFESIYPPDKIIDLIGVYMRGLYVKHLRKTDYSEASFPFIFKGIELNYSKLNEIKAAFKQNTNIYEDNYFKLSSQMFLFLTIIGEKYNSTEAQKILKYSEKELAFRTNVEVDNSSMIAARYSRFVSSILSRTTMNIKSDLVKLSDHNYMNDYVVSCRFFNKIIKKCEFKIDNGENNLELKIIYFIIDPYVYYVSKNNIESFLNEVDRNSSTTKLKALIDALNLFMSEVEYKTHTFKKSPYVQSLLTIDYKDVDFYNFCISLLINFILLMFLSRNEANEILLRYLTIFCVGGQIIMNIVFLVIFFLSKYKFYVLLSKKQLGDKPNLLQYIKIYALDAFLFNEEIYLLILIIVMGGIGIFSQYGSFLFALQLLTVIKFIDTIKEIVLAFKLRFSQLICMIGFLAILIFFYSNVGFYFLSDEFNTLINNKPENLCQTLLECTITYFNHGVRSGGGIGDVIGPVPFDNMSIYWVRWFTDMVFYITVILLLLNMINGVIVSTFSQIREESNQKEEDINNKCFICNIDRIDFEKKKIDFLDHQKNEHNLKDYIKFLVFVKRINEKDLDADQSFIIQCLKNRDIKCFPVKCSKSIGFLEDEEEVDEATNDGDDKE